MLTIMKSISHDGFNILLCDANIFGPIRIENRRNISIKGQGITRLYISSMIHFNSLYTIRDSALSTIPRCSLYFFFIKWQT